MLYKIIIKFFVIIAISAVVGNINILIKNCDFNKTYQKSIKESQITGIIISKKQEKDYYDKYIIKAKTKELLNKKYIIYVKKGLQELKYGDKIEFYSEYNEPEESRNYKGFNYKTYLKTKNINGSFWVNGNFQILAHNQLNPFSMLINNIRQQIEKNVKNFLPKTEAGILLGIILGNKDEISDELKENFKLSNMMHILSVSGMHTSYIVLALSFILNKLPKRKRYIITIFSLLFFMALINFTPSVVRAVIMALMIIIAKLIHERHDFLTSIFLSLLILLIYNPFLIQDIGVQLSFLGTLGIVLFSKQISVFINKKINIKASKILAVGVSAQILILPVLIYNFNTLSVSFILSSFISSILVAIIFILGIVVILISFISINISKTFSIILKILISILSESAKNIAGFKPLNYTVKTPFLFEIVIYYLLVLAISYCFALFSKDKWNLRRYERKIISKVKKINIKKTIKKACAILLVVIVVIALYKLIPKKLNINFIDVGQGDACLIRTPRDKTILIDGGEDENLVLDYLLDRGITKLDYIVISHFDSDHVRWHFSGNREIKSKKYNNWYATGENRKLYKTFETCYEKKHQNFICRGRS